MHDDHCYVINQSIDRTSCLQFSSWISRLALSTKLWPLWEFAWPWRWWSIYRFLLSSTCSQLPACCPHMLQAFKVHA